MSNTPVYKNLVESLSASIREGKYKADRKLGTEVGLVSETGLSRVSIRRAVDLLVEQGLVERRSGKGLYVRDQTASSRLIQLAVPNLAFDQCVHIAQGAQEFGVERGVQTQIYDAHSHMAWDIRVLRELPQSPFQGAIVTSWHNPAFTEVVYELHRQRFPFVLVDERLRDIEVPSVEADNYGGGMAVAQELLDLGHRDIGFIGNFRADSVQGRLDGLRDAVNDAGLPFYRRHVVDLNLNDPEGDWATAIDKAVRQLMSGQDAPTALFFADDQSAALGYRTLQALGLRIPQDVSVVGFDDNALCQMLTPALSSVYQPARQMGSDAMEMLLRRIARPDMPPEHHVLPTKFIGRASIGVPRRNHPAISH